MKKLFDTSSAENAIIAKEEILLPDYVPTEALHRTNEMETIAAAINPMIHGQSCTNLFIHGPSGTGKTTSMLLILDQLKDSTSKVTPVYVNCWEYPTRMAIYYKISEALGLLLPRRGLASDEVFERILETMKNQSLAILLILDELDSIIFKKEDALLYNISRARSDKGARFGIIGISNKKDLTRLLEPRVSSSLRFSSVEFKEYTADQLANILSERAKYALVPSTYPQEVIQKCAEVGSENNGSARLSLEILLKAAKRADRRDAKKIGIEDVEAVIGEIEQRPSKKHRKDVSFQTHGLNLSTEEELIIDILREGETPSSELYDAFIAKKNKTKRQIRNYLMLLEAKGLIDSKEVDYSASSFLRIKIYSLKGAG